MYLNIVFIISFVSLKTSTYSYNNLPVGIRHRASKRARKSAQRLSWAFLYSHTDDFLTHSPLNFLTFLSTFHRELLSLLSIFRLLQFLKLPSKSFIRSYISMVKSGQELDLLNSVRQQRSLVFSGNPDRECSHLRELCTETCPWSSSRGLYRSFEICQVWHYRGWKLQTSTAASGRHPHGSIAWDLLRKREALSYGTPIKCFLIYGLQAPSQ